MQLSWAVVLCGGLAFASASSDMDGDDVAALQVHEKKVDIVALAKKSIDDDGPCDRACKTDSDSTVLCTAMSYACSGCDYCHSGSGYGDDTGGSSYGGYSRGDDDRSRGSRYGHDDHDDRYRLLQVHEKNSDLVASVKKSFDDDGPCDRACKTDSDSTILCSAMSYACSGCDYCHSGSGRGDDTGGSSYGGYSRDDDDRNRGSRYGHDDHDDRSRLLQVHEKNSDFVALVKKSFDDDGPCDRACKTDSDSTVLCTAMSYACSGCDYCHSSSGYGDDTGGSSYGGYGGDDTTSYGGR